MRDNYRVYRVESGITGDIHYYVILSIYHNPPTKSSLPARVPPTSTLSRFLFIRLSNQRMLILRLGQSVCKQGTLNHFHLYIRIKQLQPKVRMYIDIGILSFKRITIFTSEVIFLYIYIFFYISVALFLIIFGSVRSSVIFHVFHQPKMNLLAIHNYVLCCQIDVFI